MSWNERRAHVRMVLTVERGIKSSSWLITLIKSKEILVKILNWGSNLVPNLLLRGVFWDSKSVISFFSLSIINSGVKVSRIQENEVILDPFWLPSGLNHREGISNNEPKIIWNIIAVKVSLLSFGDWKILRNCIVDHYDKLVEVLEVVW